LADLVVFISAFMASSFQNEKSAAWPEASAAPSLRLFAGEAQKVNENRHFDQR
jgi:hypothetical protein